jgi:hypothetical protein
MRLFFLVGGSIILLGKMNMKWKGQTPKDDLKSYLIDSHSKLEWILVHFSLKGPATQKPGE